MVERLRPARAMTSAAAARLFEQLRSSRGPRAGITVVVERGRARSRCLSPALHTELSTRSARLISP
jgi:hypothetical protein